MAKAFGIVNASGRNIWVEGLETYRTIGAFSFLGRYRIIDFPISNMSNSGIDRIQVYIRRKPRSLTEHLGTGQHYNINSKRGQLQILFSENKTENDIYNTDISAFEENLSIIQRMHYPYVVIAPSYMIYSMDFSQLLETHIDSGADITLLYHPVDNAREHYLNCQHLNLNRQKGVLSIDTNRGNAKNRNIFMDTYVMKTELFIDLVEHAHSMSSMFTLSDIVSRSCNDYDIRGVAHRGYFSAVIDFRSFYRSNMALIDFKNTENLFKEDWPIYTRTHDSCPTHYFETADVKSSVISNGCQIEGTVENSIIGRGCIIGKGAVIKNSIVLPEVEIGPNVKLDYVVVDKHAKIVHENEIICTKEELGYVRREDRR